MEEKNVETYTPSGRWRFPGTPPRLAPFPLLSPLLALFARLRGKLGEFWTPTLGCENPEAAVTSRSVLYRGPRTRSSCDD